MGFIVSAAACASVGVEDWGVGVHNRSRYMYNTPPITTHNTMIPRIVIHDALSAAAGAVADTKFAATLFARFVKAELFIYYG